MSLVQSVQGRSSHHLAARQSITTSMRYQRRPRYATVPLVATEVHWCLSTRIEHRLRGRSHPWIRNGSAASVIQAIQVHGVFVVGVLLRKPSRTCGAEERDRQHQRCTTAELLSRGVAFRGSCRVLGNQWLNSLPHTTGAPVVSGRCARARGAPNQGSQSPLERPSVGSVQQRCYPAGGGDGQNRFAVASAVHSRTLNRGTTATQRSSAPSLCCDDWQCRRTGKRGAIAAMESDLTFPLGRPATAAQAGHDELHG
uniref:Uncharacterized protein n=1 Tax=Leishmania guyanensis TaxID=5670 RepID=A0A1E1J981_LEIGU|nr:Hypothetical protein BN36_NA76650 [Leishmania guyanensis]CCM20201.1 Hypothetical protein BN36_NA76990 [Leishmania guyanensis]